MPSEISNMTVSLLLIPEETVMKCSQKWHTNGVNFLSSGDIGQRKCKYLNMMQAGIVLKEHDIVPYTQ